MQLGQIASISMMYDQQRFDPTTRHLFGVAPRPSLAKRLGAKLRRIVYRGQLGPVAGLAAA